MTEQHARLDRASLVAAISTVSIVGIGLSLTIPLLSMRLEQAQVPAWFNGVNTAVAGLATLVGAPFVPRVAQRVGVWRLLVAALVVGVATLFAFAMTDRPALWLALRLPFGFALTTLFVIGEYWVVAAAPPARRGFVMGVYSTVLSLGFAIGPADQKHTGDPLCRASTFRGSASSSSPLRQEFVPLETGLAAVDLCIQTFDDFTPFRVRIREGTVHDPGDVIASV